MEHSKSGSGGKREVLHKVFKGRDVPKEAKLPSTGLKTLEKKRSCGKKSKRGEKGWTCCGAKSLKGREVSAKNVTRKKHE